MGRRAEPDVPVRKVCPIVLPATVFLTQGAAIALLNGKRSRQGVGRYRRAFRTLYAGVRGHASYELRSGVDAPAIIY